ncbi:hypothetical protein GX50_08888 [[Emmonsia] crescens]|uniref:Phenazine biosynthesis protein n=2 Tax=[Emmonsia] crescens TaxID=73230 RepID=A0A2B7Z3A3_9EURO|nr:hypothetical protein EMCG_09719 [Emmonsia crescens UAMH 3008]PGH28376.1 hypothetical protein GX50_08888 [Emmonsia crescens]
MAAGPHTFVVADVFTSERYLGNQLAIVSVRNNALSKARKQRIALEFGYVNTVFLHDAPQPNLPRKLEIFSETEERSFSGQAVLGTAHYIFQKLEGQDSISVRDWSNPTAAEIQQKHQNQKAISRCTLETKGGLIQSHYDPARQVAAIEIPHNVHIHARETTKDEVIAVQRQLLPHPEETAKMKGSYPIFSIAPGMTFTLVDFTSCPSLLSLLEPGFAPEPDLDDGWGVRTGDDAPSPFCGCVYFLQLQTDFTEEPYITRLRVRVIAAGLEEAASASGCSALAAYLALQKGGANSRHAYAIEQGVDIGRASQLCVEVRLDEAGTGVSRVTLSAKATFVMEGKLL